MIVADSDVLIDALRGQERVAGRISEELASGVLATTAVTAFELLSGARTEGALARVRTLLDAMTVLPLDAAASDRAASIRRDLEARGSPIGMADYLIAGTCLSRSAALLTRNRAHFERVEGLRLGRL
ncbi:MAG: type II toxin-antitoxin system VapC family toxin [Gemmatimonadota bacterium]|nr:type II toxin-antitoxin system VapC family toxin [Gemmatimonadota bacterium]